ncbi:MAG: hypothetical protein JWP30_163 [Homoserinimonas sp.]|jgi:hypothetical protein|nr:hypothetical protein [Homoserinimonas sp.]
MKRINVMYDGVRYSIGGRDYEEVKQQIADALTTNDPAARWIRVNHGEGTSSPADLLITPGVTIALLPIEVPATD